MVGKKDEILKEIYYQLLEVKNSSLIEQKNMAINFCKAKENKSLK